MKSVSNDIPTHIKHVLKNGETQGVEFKTSFGRETIETVVAFSNTTGGSVDTHFADVVVSPKDSLRETILSNV